MSEKTEQGTETEISEMTEQIHMEAEMFGQGMETENVWKRQKRHGDGNIGNDRKGMEMEISEMTEQEEECQNTESENAWSITGHNGRIYEF